MWVLLSSRKILLYKIIVGIPICYLAKAVDVDAPQPSRRAAGPPPLIADWPRYQAEQFCLGNPNGVGTNGVGRLFARGLAWEGLLGEGLGGLGRAN